MKVKSTKIVGCFEIEIVIHEDNRGKLIKTFHKESFEKVGLYTDFPEHYYSVSKKKVLRGLHFQIPDQHHIKLVSCLQGSILDVVVDLRIGSPSYGQHLTIELNSEKANMLYIPKGCAHGFYTLSDNSIFSNKTSTMYSSDHDRGIHWESCDIAWPDKNPILSDKDRQLPYFENFESPFKFHSNL
jgi:dTDP-4-dehydrorhamnose 3,5-epimerase